MCHKCLTGALYKGTPENQRLKNPYTTGGMEILLVMMERGRVPFQSFVFQSLF